MCSNGQTQQGQVALTNRSSAKGQYRGSYKDKLSWNAEKCHYFQDKYVDTVIEIKQYTM